MPLVAFALAALGVDVPWLLAVPAWLAYLLQMFFGYEYRQRFGDRFYNRYSIVLGTLMFLMIFRSADCDGTNPTKHSSIPVWIQWPMVASLLVTPWLFSLRPFEDALRPKKTA